MPTIIENGTDGDDTIGNPRWTGADTVVSALGAGNDRFTGWGAAYSVDAGDGDDDVMGGGAGGTARLGAGDDSATIGGSDGDHTILGDAGNDSFTTFYTGAGLRRFYGGAGIDWFSDGSLRPVGADVFDGGIGFDWVEHDLSAGIDVSLSRGTGLGGAGGNTYQAIEGLAGTRYNDTLEGDDANNVLLGEAAADELRGGAGSDLLIGGGFTSFFGLFTGILTEWPYNPVNPFSYTDSNAFASRRDFDGDDRLSGGAGNDVLHGGAGGDQLDGGTGVDWASYLSSPAAIAVDLSAGTGTGGDAEGDLLFGIENLLGTAHADRLSGDAAANRIRGEGGDDTLNGRDGADTLTGGEGDDVMLGGDTDADLRDELFGGAGHDSINAGHGNDLIYGGDGDDTVEGGFGVDEIIGQGGNDVLTGSAFSDLIYGGDGNDFVNGGFGSDRVNGGAGADLFYHLGIADHGSDWIQDYSAAEDDRLIWGGGAATRSQFQVNLTETPNAGAAGVQEAFVIHRPTGQILWALVDGGAQSSITLQIGGQVFDLLA